MAISQAHKLNEMGIGVMQDNWGGGSRVGQLANERRASGGTNQRAVSNFSEPIRERESYGRGAATWLSKI